MDRIGFCVSFISFEGFRHPFPIRRAQRLVGCRIRMPVRTATPTIVRCDRGSGRRRPLCPPCVVAGACAAIDRCGGRIEDRGIQNGRSARRTACVFVFRIRAGSLMRLGYKGNGLRTRGLWARGVLRRTRPCGPGEPDGRSSRDLDNPFSAHLGGTSTVPSPVVCDTHATRAGVPIENVLWTCLMMHLS